MKKKRSFATSGKAPLLFAGHAISYKQGHPHVRIAKNAYQEFRAYLLNMACHASHETLEKILLTAPYEAYAPVKKQLLSIAEAVNQARKQARQCPIATGRIQHKKRRVCQPFAVPAENTQTALAEQLEQIVLPKPEPDPPALQSAADPLLAQFGLWLRHVQEHK